MDRNNCPASLFKQMPTIHFYPQAGIDGDLKVLKSREKKVVTLDIGAFRARETVLHNSDGTTCHSQQLRALTPHRATFGFDVLVYVGRALFIHCHSEQHIIDELARRNVLISPREIGFLSKKFIAYLAIAHQQSQQQIKKVMALRGGYILHLDGTCEGDSPHLFTGMDGIAQIVLDNIKLPSERAEFLIPFFRQLKQQYGDPVALVHDMGRGILSAVNTVFKGIPDFICHFHFLRDIGKDLFEKEYATIRNRLKKHKIRSLLRQKARALGKIFGDDTQEVCRLASSIENGQVDSPATEKMAAMAAYAMIQWAFDTSELEGYGFPFDCPHLMFFHRLKVLHKMVNAQLVSNKALAQLWRPLTKIVEDPQLKKAAFRMEEKLKTFKKLREALSIAVPGSKKGLNDDGQEADIKSIEEKVKKFRKEISGKKDYKKMINQIDKYWNKLFADPITVNTIAGQFTIQPQRTNNILERFFRDFKRSSRKRHGTISLNKTLKTILTDTPLVKNLDNPNYLKIILNGCSMLEERFEKIDSRLVIEKIKTEQKKHENICPEMKKIIRRSDLPERLNQLLANWQY
jgi:hypothetical protein